MLKHTETKDFRICLLMLLFGLIGLTLVFGVIPANAQAQKTLIDLNTASQKDLESLKGVGPATAKKIIAGRPYQSVEDLKKVGISEKNIEALKPYVEVRTAPAPARPAVEVKPAGPSEAKKVPPQAPAPVKLSPGQKVNLNTATEAEIEALPGIGSVKAQAIIDGRPYKNIEDIMKIKGIKQGTFNKIKDLITVQ